MIRSHYTQHLFSPFLTSVLTIKHKLKVRRLQSRGPWRSPTPWPHLIGHPLLKGCTTMWARGKAPHPRNLWVGIWNVASLSTAFCPQRLSAWKKWVACPKKNILGTKQVPWVALHAMHALICHHCHTFLLFLMNFILKNYVWLTYPILSYALL